MKRCMIILNKIMVFTIMLFMMITGLSLKAQARDLIDTSKKGSLTITYKFEESDGNVIYFDNVGVDIYKIASVNESGSSFVIESQYASVSPVTDLSLITDKETASSTWNLILEAVEPYAVNENQPIATTTTSKGYASFNDLELGIYLVRSSSYVDEPTECTYVFSSFLISVPQLDEVTDTWIYDNGVYTASSSVKCEKEKLNEKFELLKRWNDSGYENLRPSAITVAIKKNGELYDNVTLDSNNNWSYSWSDQSGFLWSFEESVSGDVSYSASVTDSRSANDGMVQITYVLTNTYIPPETPDEDTPADDTPSEDTPSEDTPSQDTPSEDTPTEDTSGFPDLPEVLGAFRDLPAVLGARRLPQTGQLWWPLPLLFFAGIILIIKGIRNNKNI